MKTVSPFYVYQVVINLVFVCFSAALMAQETTVPPAQKSDFWQHVQFGGGLGLSVGSGFTNITVAPSGIYNFNPYVSAGVGLQGSYVSSKNQYNTYVYGGSLIGLFNPIEQVQLSVEVEQARVNSEFRDIDGDISDNFWNTALFLGGGYRSGNVTIGGRYDVLFDENKTIYGSAFMPFVRVYF